VIWSKFGIPGSPAGRNGQCAIRTRGLWLRRHPETFSNSLRRLSKGPYFLTLKANTLAVKFYRF
jgi:hypothetical protein